LAWSPVPTGVQAAAHHGDGLYPRIAARGGVRGAGISTSSSGTSIPRCRRLRRELPPSRCAADCARSIRRHAPVAFAELAYAEGFTGCDARTIEFIEWSGERVGSGY